MSRIQLNDATARELAYAWHGGQFTLLYALASSGLVESRAALMDELRAVYGLLDPEQTEERDAVRALMRYADTQLHHAPGTRFPYRAPWAADYEHSEGEMPEFMVSAHIRGRSASGPLYLMSRIVRAVGESTAVAGVRSRLDAEGYEAEGFTVRRLLQDPVIDFHADLPPDPDFDPAEGSPFGYGRYRV